MRRRNVSGTKRRKPCIQTKKQPRKIAWRRQGCWLLPMLKSKQLSPLDGLDFNSYDAQSFR